MCKGKKSCRACARMSNAKIAGRMKKSSSQLVGKGLRVAGGFAVARTLTSRIPAVQANPILRIALPIGGAFLSSKFLGKNGAEIAYGMVGAAALDAVATYLPGAAAQAGVAGLGGPAYKSLHVPGVAGRVGNMPAAAHTSNQVEISLQ